MNQNQKRIVIIEGDAFDADAIVAIVKVFNSPSFQVVLNTEKDEKYLVTCADKAKLAEAMAVAVDAWRVAVGDGISIPTPATDPLPTPDREDTQMFEFWTDGKGRYRETYGEQHVWWGSVTGRFIWNEGPPRRKNPLGEGASPIVRVYVDEAGTPLVNQPI